PILYDWIERSWPALKSTLGWEQALNLISMLSKFNCPEFRVESMYNKWVETINGTREHQPMLRPSALGRLALASSMAAEILSFKTYEPLGNATHTLISKLVVSELPREQARFYLLAINTNLNFFVARFYPNNKTIAASLRLYYAAWALKAVPDDPAVVGLAFEDILTFLPSMTWNEEARAAAESFINSLPALMRVCAEDPDLMEQAVEIIHLFLEIDKIRNALPESQHSLTNLLFCLGVSVQEAPIRHVKRIAQTTLGIYTDFTNPVRLNTCRKIPPKERTTVRLFSIEMLADFLSMTQLGCLEESDWTMLFEGLNDHAIRGMIEELIALEQNKEPSKALMNLISMARIIQYAHPSYLEFLSILSFHLMRIGSEIVKELDPTEDLTIQLGLRYYYIHAATALMRKYALHAPTMVEPISKLRTKLIKNFIQSFLGCAREEASYQKFEFILIESLLGADLAVAEKMHEVFVVPADWPTEIQTRLQFLKTGLIENRIRSLRK
ncbi:MAG TPA: hypothetical protein VMR37_04190, partial [Rhabdochlamydiaceae bacterium]|nr:hypothetical protein [Rhabdochlamydiaceae bacterium]